MPTTGKKGHKQGCDGLKAAFEDNRARVDHKAVQLGVEGVEPTPPVYFKLVPFMMDKNRIVQSPINQKVQQYFVSGALMDLSMGVFYQSLSFFIHCGALVLFTDTPDQGFTIGSYAG